MRLYEPNPLPFFPAPYPGESLYSILCRYHVRSGNATTRKTILQLFGTFGSLCSTLLLPSMLECFETWTSPDTGIDADTLFRNNTAYSLCSLRSFADYRFFFPEDRIVSPAQWKLKRFRWPFQQHMIQHPSDRLRYCPACAIEQKKLYGESYWQILPQLDGVEYCPIHHIPIASTTIRTRDLLYSFFPADTIIPTISPEYPILSDLWYYDAPVECLPNLFDAMANTVAYLWENLPNYSGIWALICKYRSFLSTGNEFWQSAENVRTKLLKHGNSIHLFL